MPASSRSLAPDKRRPLALRFAVLAAIIVSGAANYTVERGDTLSEIAKEQGVSITELVEANDISNPDFIRAGQTLIIPGKDEAVVYTIQRGDTLAKIAAAHGTTVKALLANNDIANPNRIFPGRSLTISGAGATADPPADEPPAPPSAEPPKGTTTHVVASGETLAKIAKAYGVNVKSIVAENGLANPNLIRPGQSLRIPSGFVCPVAGAIFINDWGFPRSGGRFHEGNDLFAPRGTLVLAPVAGVVEQVEGPRGGLQFVLEGVDATTYIGSHLDAFGLAGNVRGGDVIGYVGNTGNAITTPPHVHFEMHPEAADGPINPYPILREACS